jgi:hypothetical protein
VAALAADYGVLGIYVWDIVMLSALAVLLLVRMRPWGSPITVVTASGPMIQDVRIVDDRSARN